MRIELYLPQQALKSADLRKVKTRLITLGGGLTTTEGLGEWKNAVGELVREKVFVLTTFVAEEGRAAAETEIAALGSEILGASEEEVVMFAVDNVTRLFSGEGK